MTTLDERIWRRFNERIDVRSADECWEWQGARTGPMKYGSLKIDGKMVMAHRLAWELANGRPVPNGLQVMSIEPDDPNWTELPGETRKYYRHQVQSICRAFAPEHFDTSKEET